MSGNVKFRWFLLAPLLVVLFVVVNSPVISLAGELEDAQERVRLNPDDANAHNDLGLAYHNSGQYKEAIASYKEALRIKPDDTYAHINLGAVYDESGQYQEAIASYKEAIRIKPDGYSIRKVIELYIKAGHYEKAITAYKEVSPSIFKYSWEFEPLKKAIDTIPSLRKAQELIRKNPNDPLLHLTLAKIYKKISFDREAILALNKALQLKSDLAEVHYELGDSYLSDAVLFLILDRNSADTKAKLKRIVDKFTEAIGIRKDFAEPHFGLGRAYNYNKQYKLANFHYKEAIRLKPDLGEAYFELGWNYKKEGEQEKAIEHFEKATKLLPNDTRPHMNIAIIYMEIGKYKNAIASFKEAIRANPDVWAHAELGKAYNKLGQHQEAIAPFKEAIRIEPNYAKWHSSLGWSYVKLGQYEEAITSYKETIRIKPDDADAHFNLGWGYENLGRNDKAIASYKEALKIDPNNTYAQNNLNKLEQKTADERLAREQRLLEEERKKHKALQNLKEADRLARERKLLEEERKKLEALHLAEENRQQPPEEQTPQSGSGSGFFVSKMGHVITNAHVVKDCNKVTVGDNANKQVAADIINTDRSNDLALLKLSTLEMASAESKSLIQKLSIVVVPLASKGLLRSEDVRLGEKVLVAGFPFGDFFSNSIKVTTGVVSATRGAGDDSGQFQLDAAIQPGNSGGPIYDSSGNIVGVVISQLDKLKVAKAIGSLPELVNFGIKASTVRQFLTSSGLPSKKSERTEEKSTEQLAEIAKNQALMVMCLQ